jgi:succinate-semialdehyde dehydrogenase/glutarate-semialdehyde dehydrogenase
MKLKSINPSTGESLEEFELATEEEASKIVREARIASKTWRETDISERSKYLSKAASLFKADRTELAKHATREMGKPLKESLAEVDKCAATLDYFAENAERMLRNEVVETEFHKSYVAFEPLGIVFAIMPWNFPYWQVIRCGAPALSAGNTVILKHSSYVPRCSLELERIFTDAGLPEFIFKNILADSKLAEKIIQSDVDALSFTGSMSTGSRIAELAGKHLKKFVLELGGSDPFIVLDDADLPFTVKWAVASRIINTGQSCIAAKRFMVMKKIAQEFEENFAKEMRALRIGDPLNPETDVGPLVREEQRILMEEFVKDAKTKGAKILTGGERMHGKGFFFKPTVLTNVNHSMRILNEETFGPLAPIIIVDDEEDAVREANSVDFGLGASIWSKDRNRSEVLARRIQAGNVYINKMVASDPRLPFGGTKKSGIGRELSRYGILEFTNIKTVLVN